MNKEIEYKIPIHETQAINKKRISKENEEWKGNSIAKKIQKRKKPATIRFLKRRFHETKALEIDFEIKKGFHKDNNRHLSLDSQISLLPLGFSPLPSLLPGHYAIIKGREEGRELLRKSVINFIDNSLDNL